MSDENTIALILTQEEFQALRKNLEYLYENADMETEAEIRVLEKVRSCTKV